MEYNDVIADPVNPGFPDVDVEHADLSRFDDDGGACSCGDDGSVDPVPDSDSVE